MPGGSGRPPTPRQKDTARTIVLPVRDSQACQDALQWVLDNLCRKGDTIHIFHVLLKASGADSQAFTAPQQHLKAARLEQAQAFCAERFTAIADSAGVPNQLTIADMNIDRSGIGEAICEKADDLQAAAVVMSASSRQGRMRWILGPTCEYVINRCHHPVILSHGE